MGHENHQLAYKCRQMKNAGKIHSTWLWNNAVNLKLSERSNPVKLFHIVDVEKLLGIDNLDDFINSTSFSVFLSPFILCSPLYVFSLL